MLKRSAFLALSAAVFRFVAVKFDRAEFPTIRDVATKGPYTHIVVPGAWMRSDGKLSATFKNRVNTAMKHQRTHRATVVFTGGLSEGPRALAYAKSTGGCGAGCLYENRSTKTWENAREAARVIRNKSAAVLVVTSPYHQARCLAYFSRFWQAVDVAPAVDLDHKREKCYWDRRQVDYWLDRPGLCVADGLCVPRPRWRLAWFHSCLLGRPYVAAAREVLAWGHNILTFRTTVYEAHFAWLRYRGGRKRGRKDKMPRFMKE